MVLNLQAVKLIYNTKTKIILVVIFLLLSSSINAHGDLSIRINEKTKEISKSPNNPELYLQRGFLYKQHNEFTKALKDYLKSEELGLKSKLLYYRLSEAYFFNNEYENALKVSDLCLDFDENDVKTRKIKAQILFRLNRLPEALSHYKFVIEHTLDINPEDIIEYSEFILSHDKSNYKDAIATLDFGLQKIGIDTYSLQLKKLEYFKSSQNIEQTISQYNYFILNSNRKESWYYNKASYLFDNNLNEEARIALEQAKFNIDLLDQKFKNTSSLKKLQDNIKLLELKLNLI